MATSTDSVKSSPLALQYEQLNNNFNQVNGWLKEVLREGGSKHQIKSCLLSLEQLSKEMKEVVEKMNSEDPIEASRYSLMQNDARIEMQKRIAESLSRFAPFERLPDDVQSLIFSGLSCCDLSVTSRVVTDWTAPCQEMLESAIQHVIQKPCLTQDELVEKIYFLAKCNRTADVASVIRNRIGHFIKTYEQAKEVLCSVVAKLVRSGNTELALQFIREYRNPSGNIYIPLLLIHAASQALQHAIDVLLELDDVERALAIARGLEQPDRHNYLQYIARKRYEVGDIERAIEMMSEINPDGRSSIALSIMNALKEQGRNEEAIALLPDTFADEWDFHIALRRVVIPILLQEGDFERAIGMALCATNSSRRTCLIEVFRYFIEHEEIDRAYDLLKHMSVIGEDLRWPTNILRKLAVALAQRGSLDRAIEVHNHAPEAYQESIMSDIRLADLEASALQN